MAGCHRYRLFATSLLLAGSLPLPIAGQVITLRADSARRVVAPSARFAVPMILDMSAAAGQTLASITAGVAFGSSRLTFDSVRTSGFGALTSNIASAASGSLSLSLFDGTGTSTTQTMATLWFTASATTGGTTVAFTPTVAGSDVGSDILAMVRTRNLDVCVATSGKWGDVNGDSVATPLGDGNVNIIDAQQIARYTVSLAVANRPGLVARGDVTADGSVNIIDAQQIARYTVGLPAAARVNTSTFVAPTVATVAVSPSTPQSIAIAGTVQLTAVARDAGSADVTACAGVTWASSNASVATVSVSGLVVGVNAGTATITVTSGAQSAQVAVTVGGGSGAATQVAVVTPAAGAVSGTAFTTQPVVAIRDAQGNLRSADNSTIVTMTSSAGSSVVGTSSRTASGGVASFTTVGVSGSPGATYTLTYSAPGLTSASQTVTLAAAAAPDLVIDSMTAPSTGVIGGSVAISMKVRNQGTAVAAAFRVGFYYSTDATISTSDVYAGAACDYPAGLAAGASNVCSGPISVPVSLAPGSYYIGALADDLGQIAEGSESNNARAAATATVLNSASSPDLVVDALTAAATGTVGGTIAVAMSVRNQGTAAAGAFRVGLYYSTDATITTADVSAGVYCDFADGLSANTVSSCDGPIPVPSTLAPGTYYVGVIADYLGQVAEGNESNNARASASSTVIGAAAAVDLSIDAMTAPSSGAIGSTIAVSTTVNNRGSSAAGAFRIGFYTSTDATITTADVFTGSWCDYPTGLAASTTNTCSGPITVPASLTAGTYYVGAIADYLTQVSESNETNNTRASSTPTTLTVSAAPDLVIDAMSAPTTGTLGGTIAVSLTVRNQGTQAAGPFRVGVYYSSDANVTMADAFSYSYCDYPDGLAAGASSTCSGPADVPSSLQSGSYHVGAIADDLGQVTEGSEANNGRAASNSTALSSPSGVDLTIEEVTAPASGLIGSTITVSGIVRNAGSVASGAFRLGFYLSADAVISPQSDVSTGSYCDYPSGLAAGAGSNCGGPISVPSELASGPWYVGVVADYLGTVSETNETNNGRAAPSATVLSTVPLADLVVDAVSAPSSGLIGGSVGVSMTVRNQGTGSAGAFRVAFFYSTDATITTGDVYSGGYCDYPAGLAVATSNVCSGPIPVPSSLPAGTYYVGAIADYLQQVTELTESNNSRSAPTPTAVSTVGQLNLTVDGLYLTQATQSYAGTVPIVANRDALLRVFVKANIGNAVQPQVRVRTYNAAGVLQNTRTINATASGVSTTISEADLASSWNATIPASEVQLGMKILADVDPAGTVSESNETDNTWPANGTAASLDVRTVPTFNVTMVPILQSVNGYLGNVTSANVNSFLAMTRKVWPLSSVSASVRTAYTTTTQPFQSGDQNGSWSAVLSELRALRTAEGSGRHYYGVLKVSYNSGIAGLGYIGLPAAIGWDYLPSGDGTMAHELGHNFGRQHAPCGGPANPDPNFPYAGGAIGVYGYDMALAKAYPPTDPDLMTYCHPEWISDYTYRGGLDYIVANPTSAASVGDAVPSVMVWGRVEDGSVVLEPAFELVAPPTPSTGSGKYRVTGFSPDGKAVLDVAFDAEPVEDAATPSEHFAVVIPKAALGGSELASLLVTGQAGASASRRSLRGALVAEEVAVPTQARRNSVGTVELRWDAQRYPLAVVRSTSTGEILSFARGGVVVVPALESSVDVVFSDGVRSALQRIPVTP